MLRKIFVLFLVWKAVVLTFAHIASIIIPSIGTSDALEFAIGTPYLNWVFANFDGVHYLSIAKFGYSYPDYAFFPLLPMLIYFLHHYLSIQPIEAGLLISNISLFFSLFFIYKIVRLDYDEKVAIRSLIFLLVFPVSFFYGAVYTDSLYLLLSTVSFYFARQSKWLPAGVLGFLAGAARLVGIVLVLALLIEWCQQNIALLESKKERVITTCKAFIKQRAYAIFLIPLAIVIYGAYLQITRGDFLLFQKAMAEWSQASIVFPPQVVFRYIRIFLTATPSNLLYPIAVLEFVTAFFYLLLSVYVLKKVRLSYGILMLLTILLPTFTGTFQSMPRYLLHLFPGFLALSLLTNKSKKVFAILVIAFVLLQFLLVALYTRGYFVA